jgi:hypothetical protein
MNTRSLRNTHKKKSGERAGHAIGQFTDLGNGCWGIEGGVLLEVNTSFLVIFIEMWSEELMEHVQIHDTSIGRLQEEEEAIHSFFAEGAKHVHIWAVTNFSRKTRGFYIAARQS